MTTSTQTAGPTLAGAPAALSVPPRRWGLRGRAIRVPTVLASIWLVVLCLLAVGFSLLPLDDPTRTDYSAIAVGPFSPNHVLGTDTIGRDMLSRLLVGAQVSLAVGLGGAALAVLIGSVLGLLAGFYGGAVSRVINGVMDVFLAFPSLIALIALSVFMGTGMRMAIIGFGVVAAPQVARVTRGATLVFTQREFVTAARAMGARNTRILVREIIPNVVGPVLAYATVLVAVAIVAEGSLSFLGLGVPQPTSSWGSMMADGRTEIARAPHIVLLPAAFMFVTLLALYFLAEALNRKFDIKEASL